MKKIIGLMFVLAGFVTPVEADTIVDSLGAATPSSQFGVAGTGGCSNAVDSTQSVGPEFTLTQPTFITEIGGFFVNCGPPQCPKIAQFVVQIRPSTNGVPDPSDILASYPLSKNDNLFVSTYQSAPINLPLEAGTYFALFAPLEEDMSGYVVGSATTPFLYQAGIVTWGSLNPPLVGPCRDAVRILGIPIEPIAIDIKPGGFPNSVNPRSAGVIPVAILATATFDPTTVNPTTVRFGKTGTEAAPVHFAFEDVDGDGDTDMILQFNIQQTGIRCGDTSATVTGKTFSGKMIDGSDSVNTVGCR